MAGGYPQTAGIKFTIDTTKPYDSGELYPNSTYHAPNSIQRVSIESVNGQPFDPDATYELISSNFITDGGDTYYVCGTKESRSTGADLEKTVQDYIIEALNGKITKEQYGEPRGDQTIILTDGAAADTSAAAKTDTDTEKEKTTDSSTEANTEANTDANTDTKASTQIYVVLPGDFLWKIARNTYGNGEAWTKIYEANKAQITDPNMIYPGQQLTIPA